MYSMKEQFESYINAINEDLKETAEVSDEVYNEEELTDSDDFIDFTKPGGMEAYEALQEKEALNKTSEEKLTEIRETPGWSHLHNEELNDTLRIQQIQKLEIMNTLQEYLSKIDNNKEIKTNNEAYKNRDITSWNEDENYGYVRPRKGEGKNLIKVTLGELITDGYWGVDYTLNSDLPRDVRKKYVIERAKQEMSEIYDSQIIEEEIINPTNTKKFKKHPDWDTKSDVYNNIKELKDSGKTTGGLLTEKMVKTNLMKMAIDSDLPFSVEDVEIFQDVEYKIDFIIHIHKNENKHKRGVGTETGETIGIQYTINDTKEAEERKNSQIETAKETAKADVDDIILVTLPINEVFTAYNTWNSSRLPSPGGPNKLLSQEIQEEVFKGVFKNLEQYIDVNESWKSISDKSKE